MRIVMAEDGALFREGLVVLLEHRGHDVVAAVTDADALLEAVQSLQPDIAVIDIRMPSRSGRDGADAAVQIRQRNPECGLLLLSQHIELRRCRPLIGTPGFGYLLKDRVLDVTQFCSALERVAAGGTALDEEIVQALVQASDPGELSVLSDRERDVLAQVAQGLSNSAVARALHLSPRTVETHMRAIFLKLGLPDDDAAHRRVLAVLAFLRH